MNNMELIESRHSVRQFLEKKVEDEKKKTIVELIEKLNKEHDMNIQVFFDEPNAFSSSKVHYGKFEKANNYIALVGCKEDGEKLGFYGEEILLKIYELQIAGCWVALTYNKGKVVVNKEKNEKLHVVICFGYGKTAGVPHKSKPVEQIVSKDSLVPSYANEGIEACLLAPTAMNQQKFEISFSGDEPIIKTKGIGFYTDVDLGIVKYHFELATGHKVNRNY